MLFFPSLSLTLFVFPTSPSQWAFPLRSGDQSRTRPFAPSPGGELVKAFLYSRFFPLSTPFFFLFLLLPLIEPLEPGADGKLVEGVGKVSERDRERRTARGNS